MIDRALTFLEEQTELYFQKLLGASTQKYASLGNIARITDSGEITEDGENAGIIITLVNIEEDRTFRNFHDGSTQVDKVKKTNPQVSVNLYVLFSVNIPTYSTALERLSNIITCFQKNNLFTGSAFQSLDPGIERLNLELHTMSFEQNNHLWSTFGGKYFPSVLYKMKMLITVDEAKQAEGLPLTEIQLEKKFIRGSLK